MAIIVYVALIGLVLIVQGLYIFKTGDLRWFLIRRWTRSRPRALPKFRVRVASGILYFSCGVAVLTVLAYQGWRHFTITIGRAQRHGADAAFLVYSTAFLAAGVWCVAHPVGMIRWVRNTHVDLAEDNQIALRTIRVIGAGLSLIAVYGIFLSFYYIK